MRTLSLAVLGVIGAAGAARGAEATLVVSVEVAPGVDVNPGEVRHMIATELGTPVVGAREPAAAGSADVLLVTVEPREIHMSLRTSAAPLVSRTIAAPPARPERLRSIGWLAGNLARDQVGPLVAAPAGSPSVPPAIAEARVATEPPSMTETPRQLDSGSPEAVIAARPSPRDAGVPSARWSITAAGGPTLSLAHAAYFVRGTAYQIELRHQSAPDSPLFGAAIEVGPDAPSRHYFGVAALVGSSWRRRRWFLEGTLGLGLEELDAISKKVTVTNNSSQLGTEEQTTVSLGPIPGLFLRVAGLAGVHISSSFDIVAQLGAHVSTTGQLGSYLGSTVGLRLRLP
jgi:hypothetical protein